MIEINVDTLDDIVLTSPKSKYRLYLRDAKIEEFDVESNLDSTKLVKMTIRADVKGQIIADSSKVEDSTTIPEFFAEKDVVKDYLGMISSGLEV